MSEIEPGAFREEHFTLKQLGKLWSLRADYIRRRFANEPGVKNFHGNKPGTRQYVTLHIPASVAALVMQSCSCPLGREHKTQNETAC
jgi:hypothetical protein